MIKILNVPSLYSSLYKVVDFCKEHSNEKIEIIVPDKLSLFMERFLFEQMNICASFNIKVSTLNRFAKKSYVVENIDCTIIAQRPKMLPYIEQMICNIANALSIEKEQVNVKATTEEGLGFTGNGEGISAHAVCLITKK